jgi:hypothetical protein
MLKSVYKMFHGRPKNLTVATMLFNKDSPEDLTDFANYLITGNLYESYIDLLGEVMKAKAADVFMKNKRLTYDEVKRILKDVPVKQKKLGKVVQELTIRQATDKLNFFLDEVGASEDPEVQLMLNPLDMDDSSITDCDRFSMNPSNDPTTNRKFATVDQFMEYKTKCNVNEPVPLHLCESLPGTNLSVCGYTKTSSSLFTSDPNDFMDVKLGNGIIVRSTKTNNWDEIKEWMGAQKRYMDSLPYDEREAMLVYNGLSRSKPGAQSFAWNRILRGDTDLESGIKQDVYDTLDHIQLFYKTIMGAPRTPNMLVFRGDKVTNDDNYLTRRTFEKKDFVSLSLSLKVAEQYSKLGGLTSLESAAMSQIQLPYGTPAIFIAGANYPDIDDRVEIVLPPSLLSYQGYYELMNSPLNKNLPPPGASNPQFYCWLWQQTLPLRNLLSYCTDDPLKPTNEEVLESFVQYISTKTVPGLTMVTKGGYGYNLLLKTKYGMTNLIPTHDLDLSFYYDSDVTDEAQRLKYLEELQQLLNAWKESLPLEVKNSVAISTRDTKDVAVVFVRYQYCKSSQGLVDVSLIGMKGGFPVELIDQATSKKTRLPVKTELGYLDELLYMFFKENIIDLDTLTYLKRNMFEQEGISKGVKTIKRIANLCEQMSDHSVPYVDKSGRSIYNYGKICSLFASLSVNDMRGMGPKKMSKLAQRLKDNKSVASFYVENSALRAVREKRNLDKVRALITKHPLWLFQQEPRIFNAVAATFAGSTQDKENFEWFNKYLKDIGAFAEYNDTY